MCSASDTMADSGHNVRNQMSSGLDVITVPVLLLKNWYLFQLITEILLLTENFLQKTNESTMVPFIRDSFSMVRRVSSIATQIHFPSYMMFPKIKY